MMRNNTETYRIGGKTGRIGAFRRPFLSFEARTVLYATIQVHMMKLELISGLGTDNLWSTTFPVSPFSVCVRVRPYWIQDCPDGCLGKCGSAL